MQTTQTLTPEQVEVIENRKNIVFGFLEAWWCLVEYFLIIVFLSSLVQHGFWTESPKPILDICAVGDEKSVSSIIEFVKCVITNDYSSILVGATKVSIRLLIICFLMYVRYGNLWYDNATRNLPFRYKSILSYLILHQIRFRFVQTSRKVRYWCNSFSIV